MKGIDFVPQGLEGCRPPIDKTFLFEGLMIRTPLLILLQGRRLELGAEEPGLRNQCPEDLKNLLTESKSVQTLKPPKPQVP